MEEECFQCKKKMRLDDNCYDGLTVIPFPICEECKKEMVSLKLTKGQSKVLKHLIYCELSFVEFNRKGYDYWDLKAIYEKL